MLRAHVARRFFASTASSSSSTASPISHAVASATASTSETSTRAAASPTAATANSINSQSDRLIAQHRAKLAKYQYPAQPARFNWKDEQPQLAGLALFGAFVVFAVVASPSTSDRKPHH